jgi:heme oxygenase
VSRTPAVTAYTEHLDALGESRPLLLLAHSYTQHLAMAMGGQIIRRHARKAMKLPEDEGTAVFEFEVLIFAYIWPFL